VLVGDDRVGCAGGINERASQFTAAVLQRDADNLEVFVLVLLIESLPPGQLFAASSPGPPEEEQQALFAQVAAC